MYFDHSSTRGSILLKDLSDRRSFTILWDQHCEWMIFSTNKLIYSFQDTILSDTQFEWIFDKISASWAKNHFLTYFCADNNHQIGNILTIINQNCFHWAIQRFDSKRSHFTLIFETILWFQESRGIFKNLMNESIFWASLASFNFVRILVPLNPNERTH